MLDYWLETCYTEGVMSTLNADTVEIVYDFICAYMADNGYPPSLRELSKGTYMSVASVIRYLDWLEAQGRIRRDPNISRGITLLGDEDDP